MTKETRHPTGNYDSDVEQLLRAAAGYDPTSAMPDGLAVRALSRKRRQARRGPLAPVAIAAVIVTAIGLARIAGVGRNPGAQTAWKIGSSSNVGSHVASGMRSAWKSAPVSRTGALRAVRKPLAAGKEPAVAASGLVSSLPEIAVVERSRPYRRTGSPNRLASADHARAAIRLTAHHPSVDLRRSLAANGPVSRHSRVWRTEIEKSVSVGYITPALLVSLPNPSGERSVTPAAVAVTVHAATTICRSPGEGGDPGGANTTTTLAAAHEPETKRGD